MPRPHAGRLDAGERTLEPTVEDLVRTASQLPTRSEAIREVAEAALGAPTHI